MMKKLFTIWMLALCMPLLCHAQDAGLGFTKNALGMPDGSLDLSGPKNAARIKKGSNEYVLSADALSMYLGKKGTLSITLANTGEVDGMQFDFTLPAGVSVATDDDGVLAVTTTDRTAKLSAECVKMAGNTYRVVALSMNRAIVAAGSGAVLNIELDCSGSAAVGNYSVAFSYVSLSCVDGKRSVNYSANDFTTPLSIFEHSTIVGDADGNFSVDVTDVMMMVGHILTRNDSRFIFANADLDKNGVVNVTDVMNVVNIILHKDGDTGLGLSLQSVSLEMGKISTVKITSGNGSYTVSSSDEKVATATLSGAAITITGKAIGKAVVTVKDTKTNAKKEISVTVGASETAYLSCPDDHHPHMIDLGLPSGTKWACCNVDADPSKHSPTNYGGYFSWGETEAASKDAYNWFSYIYCDGSMETCHDLGNDIAGTEHDVAHVKWGGQWAMPSYTQINELIANTTSVWTTKDGVKGRVFTGNNGASIFMPAGGHYTSDGITDVGVRGRYWGSTLSQAYNRSASIFRFSSTGRSYDFQYRCNGSNVRPVSYAQLALSAGSVEVEMGKSSTVVITSGGGSYTVTNSDERIATATLSGSTITVTGKAIGKATVTVKDLKTSKSKTIAVTVGSSKTAYLSCPDDHHPHMIDLSLPSGTKWACCNVDTDHPENQSPTNYGGYYAWGETETKSTYDWNTYIHCDGSSSTCHDLGSDIAGTEYDVAHVKWGDSWTMPSKVQQDELRNNCTYEWTTENGVNGGKFTSKKNGGSIFLPAAGDRDDSSLDYAGSRGYYWSSTQDPSATNYASKRLYFGSGGTGWYFNVPHPRYNGLSVRPVSRN